METTTQLLFKSFSLDLLQFQSASEPLSELAPVILVAIITALAIISFLTGYLKKPHYDSNSEQHIVNKNKKEGREVFQPVNTDRLPWHIRAGQLLRLNDRKYNIDLGDYDPYTRSKTTQDNQYKEPNTGEDWYQKYNCFISKYGEQLIAILCCEKIPRQNQIDRLIKDMGDKFEKILIVMENNDRYDPLEVPDSHQLEYHYQYEMLRSLVDFSDYKNWLYRQFHKEKLPNSEQTLNDIYVPLKAAYYAPQPNNEYLKKGDPIENVEQYVLGWANNTDNSNEHLAIVGEYGQGKSVLSQKIALEMLSDPEKYKRIPIIIELRGTSPRNRDALDILGKFATENGLKAQALYQLHRAGKLLIILEGFDEMDLVGDTEMLMQHFQKLWQLAREPQSRIIITGRPNLFTDDPQRRKALGINPPRTHLPYTRAVHLVKMDVLQIEATLKNADAKVKDGILKALAATNENSSFAELVTRPSTLYQLSTVWGNEIGEDISELNAATVIGKFIQEDYERQDAKKVEMPLTADERSYFITGIAVGMMMENGYTNQISTFLLRDIVGNLLDNFPKISPYRDTAKGKKQGHLLNRLRESKYDFETVFKDVIAGGILVTDLSGSDTFRFAHKSYLEYLVSDFYVNQLLQDEERTYDLKIANAIKKALIFKDDELEQSPDVDNFVVQLIADRTKLKNEKGQKIFIKENEKVYSEYIFNKLCQSSFGYTYPNFTFWNGLHKGLLQLNSLVLLIAIMGGACFALVLPKLMLYIFLPSFMLWYYGLYHYSLLKKGKQIVPTPFVTQLQIWQRTIRHMGIKKTSPQLSKNVKMALDVKGTNGGITLASISLQLGSGGILIGFIVFIFSFIAPNVFFGIAIFITILSFSGFIIGSGVGSKVCLFMLMLTVSGLSIIMIAKMEISIGSNRIVINEINEISENIKKNQSTSVLKIRVDMESSSDELEDILMASESEIQKIFQKTQLDIEKAELETMIRTNPDILNEISNNAAIKKSNEIITNKKKNTSTKTTIMTILKLLICSMMLIAIYFAYRLFYIFYKALKAEQKRQEEASIFMK